MSTSADRDRHHLLHDAVARAFAPRARLRAGCVLSAAFLATASPANGIFAVSNKFGAALPAEIFLPSLLAANGGDGSAGFVIPGDWLYVNSAGDVNGDGFADIAVGGRTGDGNIGVHIVFGRDDFEAEFLRESLHPSNGGDGTSGFVAEPDVVVGRGAGDFNGDGIEDLLVTGELSVAFVIFGRAQGFPAEISVSSLLAVNGGDGSEGVALDGSDQDVDTTAWFSMNPVAAGDVNADGFDDVIVACSRCEHNGGYRTGKVFVVFGAPNPPAEIQLSSLELANGGNGSAGFLLYGEDSAFVGRSAYAGSAPLGDVSGDGIDDFVIDSSGQTDDPVARAYVVFGRSGSPGFPAEIDLETLEAANGGDGSIGFTINGGPTLWKLSFAPEAAGDVNGDGIRDIALDGRRDGYIVFGRPTAFPAEFDLQTLYSTDGGDGSEGLVLTTINESVSYVGDINGDGIDDISAPRHSPHIDRVFAVYGKADGYPAEFDPYSLEVPNGGDGSEGSVLVGDSLFHCRPGNWYCYTYYEYLESAGGDDFNGDGFDDLLITGRTDHGTYTLGDRAYVLFGAGAGPDTDSDGITDSSDNCTLIANPDQRDTNGDGFGNACDPDLNDDGSVNFLDLTALKGVFFTVVGDPGYDADADFTGDDAINFADLLVMKTLFFGVPGPSGLAP